MKVTVIGAGAIGGNLAAKLSTAGHDVQVADARAAEATDAVQGRDVIILATPFGVAGQLAGLFALVPAKTVVIDTANYYPHLNGQIEAVDNGAVDSVWNAEQLGRPVVKAWNAALAETQRTRGVPAGTPGRLALPVAADSVEARRVAMQLVDDTGFDPYDAGTLADSWRQQPNSPAYCTELTLDELPAALAAADRAKDAAIRDSVPQRFAALGANPTLDDIVEMNRAAHR
ncbi:NADP oxidoreductase, coenzyme F420-dependent [Streptomyces lincolnensis]|uniref:NADP oxidoreductase, coenzyme F420-dependent n=1 Tax=Streptomyces lincolnensis TaxID=1915 RepID=A0A1B1M360_STRLN|nr:NAD(P)-binding domain-containing protein [Streptomyces lincolnensis]ANS62867.1 NADP oxidoreductase, coenzyme F420-dependent [Streptomyces lincolnensis]AXG51791.1 NADP oxidoreductase, coenzyme F420-dependent [Streptomyces lincolnensis]QMV04803.1 NADP oxidoreductase [Streptomyces lincolnensis]